MNGAIATIRITVAAAIPVHIHGSLEHVTEALPELAPHAERRAGLEHARARQPERGRGDEERGAVDRPDERRAGRVVERRCDRQGRRSRCRSARRRATSSPTAASAARRRAARCPRTPAGRSRRRARTASRARGSPWRLTWPVTSSTKNVAITQRAREVGADHQQPPRVPVGEHAAPEQRHEHRERLERQHEPERARLPRQVGDAPAERDDERRVADERHGLAAPEEPEVAARERHERALPRNRHRPRLSSRACLFAQSCSTSTSRSPSRARISARRATSASARGTG